MPAKGMPCAAANAASGPSRVPMYRNRASGRASLSAWATASTGVAEPPEPPPASRMRSSVRFKSCFVLRAFPKTLHGQLDQPGHQLGKRQATGLPQLGIHADHGEARHGVDLVQIQPPGCALQKEVHPRQARRVDRLERGNRKALYLASQPWRNFGRNEGLRARIDVLGTVVVELGAGHDLA